MLILFKYYFTFCHRPTFFYFLDVVASLWLHVKDKVTVCTLLQIVVL